MQYKYLEEYTLHILILLLMLEHYQNQANMIEFQDCQINQISGVFLLTIKMFSMRNDALYCPWCDLDLDTTRATITESESNMSS